MFRGIFAVLFAALGIAAQSHAQDYPNKTIRLVAPFAAGATLDILGRIVAQNLSESLGKPVIVENRPGAATNIGMQAVAKAAPDGYTLLMASPSLATNGALFANLPFDPARDFAPVAKIGYAPLVVVVPATSPYTTFAQLLAAGKAAPGKLIYGSAGNGSSGHLAGELMAGAAGVEMLHVPYKGGAQALTDLIGERLTFMPLNPVEVVGHVRSNRLRALAVASARRLPLFPDVPTASEAGLAGFEASVWWGLVGPAHLPADVVERLNAATQASLAEPATREKLAEFGAVVDTGPAAALGDFIRAETARWARVIRAANIRPD